MSKERINPIYLCGQTGSGKSKISIELSRILNNSIEIINADAFQIYKNMPILTAVPTLKEREGIPHHLFEILNPKEECNAEIFSNLARKKISEVSKNKVPLIVGGSGLYLKAITHGLTPLPKSDLNLRNTLDSISNEDLIEKYYELDPIGASSSNLKNRRYVTRNIEISILTGKPASEIKKDWEKKNYYNINAIYLKRDREDIYNRINKRTIDMFDNGVVDEVRELENMSSTASCAIGFREIKLLLENKLSIPETIDKIQTLTRRYSKRQATWFKRESYFKEVLVGKESSYKSIARDILKKINLGL